MLCTTSYFPIKSNPDIQAPHIIAIMLWESKQNIADENSRPAEISRIHICARSPFVVVSLFVNEIARSNLRFHCEKRHLSRRISGACMCPSVHRVANKFLAHSRQTVGAIVSADRRHTHKHTQMNVNLCNNQLEPQTNEEKKHNRKTATRESLRWPSKSPRIMSNYIIS